MSGASSSLDSLGARAFGSEPTRNLPAVPKMSEGNFRNVVLEAAADTMISSRVPIGKGKLVRRSDGPKGVKR